MIQKKVLQRLGVLRRIKHLLPESTREVVVNTLILPLLDYGDLVWSDKANDTIMNSLQVLQNKAVKEILNMRNDDSSTMALQLLNWKPLKLRRQSIDTNLCTNQLRIIQLISNSITAVAVRSIHIIQYIGKDHLRLPAINTHWGQLRTNYHFIKDWNILPESVTNAETKTSFKSEYWNLSS